jgi:nucleotide-binding universal stress UspA family protein
MLVAMTRTGEPTEATPAANPAEADYTSVLVPLDGSDLAERALAPGRSLAARFGAELHIVVAGVGRDESWWYKRYVDGVRERMPGVTAHLSDDQDVPAAIVSAARATDPCLVCMATHGRSRTAAIVGSTFTAVATTSGAPLVATGPRVAPAGEGTEPDDPIVVCLDGGTAAEVALPLAAAWARRLGLRVLLLTAADPVLLRSELARERIRSGRRYGPDGDPQAYLHDIAGRRTFDGLAVDTQVLWGLAHPHVSIGEHLDRHPATVVATTSRARAGIARAALGSEAARLIRRSPAPVLVQPVPRG